MHSESHCALRLRYRDRPRTLNELKTAVTAVHKKHLTSRSAESVCEKIKRVQASIDARGHHFQHQL